MADSPVPPRLERALEDLQDVGLAPSLVERFVAFWRRHGLRKALIVMLAVTLPLWRYVWIPHGVSSGLGAMAEAYGADLEVDDWSSDWSNIRVTGEDVVLKAPGPYSNQHLLEADEIVLDWSLLRSLGGMYDRLKALVLFRDAPLEEPVQAITLRRATLHMERLLSGRWNWQDAVEVDRIDPAALAHFRVPAIDAEQLRLQWVEHLPANSGGGLVEQTTASLFVEDVRMRLTDVVLPQDARPNATSFSIDGRSADGRFSATGSLNLARWSGQQAVLKAAAADGGVPSWMPTFDVSIYLENVGAAALTRLVSDATLLPSAGAMTGRIQLAVSPEGTLTCSINLQMRNVQYAPNPRSRYVQIQQNQLDRELQTLVINGPITRDCSTEWTAPGFRLAKALQAEITGEAVATASPLVQGAAGYDRLRFVEQDQAAVDRFTTELSAKIGAAIGGERGAAVAEALAAAESKSANPVSRGLRSVGRGFKRLFGGGKKP